MTDWSVQECNIGQRQQCVHLLPAPLPGPPACCSSVSCERRTSVFEQGKLTPGETQAAAAPAAALSAAAAAAAAMTVSAVVAAAASAAVVSAAAANGKDHLTYNIDFISSAA